MSVTSTDSNFPPSRILWTEQDELRLLEALHEMAEEPVEFFNPTINPFLRLEKSLGKPFSEKEILVKIKELKGNFEHNRIKILSGKSVGVYNSPVFKISHAIWGAEVYDHIYHKICKEEVVDDDDDDDDHDDEEEERVVIRVNDCFYLIC